MTLSKTNLLSSGVITSRSKFDNLEPEWNNLLKTTEADSIFLTHEWLSTWLDTVYPEARLFVVIVRDNNKKLIAAAPFYISEFKFVKVFNYKYLRFIGDCHSGAEYPDIIVSPYFEKSSLGAIREVLFKNRNLWDCAWLPNMDGWTGSYDRFIKSFGEHLSFSRRRPASFSSMKLPESFNTYLKSLSKSRRNLIQRQEKKLATDHDVQFEVCQGDNDIEIFLDDLFRLHRIRWQSLGQEGSFIRRPLMADFYRKFAPQALTNGWLGFFRLKIDGKTEAIQYGYIYNNVFNQLQEGFNPSFSGIGNVLRLKIIEWCIENNLKEYDFLGEHTDHKESWGSRERFGHHIFLGGKIIRNRLLALHEIWPTGRLIDQGDPQ